MKGQRFETLIMNPGSLPEFPFDFINPSLHPSLSRTRPLEKAVLRLIGDGIKFDFLDGDFFSVPTYYLSPSENEFYKAKMLGYLECLEDISDITPPKHLFEVRTSDGQTGLVIYGFNRRKKDENSDDCPCVPSKHKCCSGSGCS